MAGYILKYSAGTYQRKISALEGYYSQLVTHLEQLNTLQGQMKDFWDGSASSAEYMNLISDKINEVKNRMEDCKNTNIQYQQVVDDLANAGYDFFIDFPLLFLLTNKYSGCYNSKSLSKDVHSQGENPMSNGRFFY